MKKITNIFSFVLISLILMQFSAYGQNFSDPRTEKLLNHFEQVFKKALADQERDLISLPQKIHGYTWADPNWNEELYEELTYHPNGQMDVVTDYDPVNPSNRTTYSYDANWRVTQMLLESYTAGVWENLGKYTMTYDANGNQSEYDMFYWTGSGWMLIAGTKTTYSYTPENYVSQVVEQAYVMFQWTNIRKDIYTLNGNGYATMITYQKYNTSWADSVRYTNISWYAYYPYSGVGSFLYFEMDSWTGSQWNPTLRETTDYDGSGGYVTVQEVYNTGVWVNNERQTLTVFQGQPESYKVEEWQGGLWVQTEGWLYLLTFNGIDLTEAITQIYDPDGMNYVNSYREVYSDFLHITGIGDTPSDAGLSVFPNPANDRLNISFDKVVPGNLTFDILNVEGQKIYSQQGLNTIGSGSYSLSLNGIPKGIYFLKLSGSTESRIIRFVIE
jgi:hypothetical protein